MFIELRVDEKFVYKQYLKQDEEAKAEFLVPKGKKVTAYAFCNLHGL